MVLNVDMHDRFLFNDELQYETKCSKHITLNDSQVTGIKSHFRKETLVKYNKGVSEVSHSINLKNCHESIKHIAIGLVRSIDTYCSKAEVNIMQDNHSALEVNDNKYSIFTINNTLFAHKEGSSYKDTAKVNLSAEQMSKCMTVDFENEIDPYIVQLDEEREAVLNS